MPPTVQYFRIRGRGEPIKLALAAQGIDFVYEEVDYPKMKSDIKTFHFGQCPRFYDEGINVCQSNAILRHIGRKYDMYGKSLNESALVDEVIDGVEDIKRKYLELIYQKELSKEAKAEHLASYISPDGVKGRNGGAHWKYLETLLLANNDGTGFVVGDSLTVADIVLFDLLDAYLRIFPEEFKTQYPPLVSFHARMAAIPGIKAYIESPKRMEKINNNGLG